MSEQHSTPDATPAGSTAATPHDTEAARGRRQASPFVAVAVGAVILGAGSAVTVQAFASDGHPVQSQGQRGGMGGPRGASGGMGWPGSMGAPSGMAGRTGMRGSGMPGSGTQGAPGAQAAPGGVQQNPAPGA